MDREKLLQAIYQAALDAGLGESGARVAVAIALTEGALEGQIGDDGQSFGPFQFYQGGMLPYYAKSLGVSESEAGQYARTNPVAAASWALNGYLGDAIRKGQKNGLQGADLATFAQRTGQRSIKPERAGQVFQTMEFNYERDAGGAPAQTMEYDPERDGTGGFQTLEQRRPGYVSTDLMPSQRAAVAGRDPMLTTAEAESICGPYAAIAFARAYGRNPTTAEAKRIAVSVGWNQDQGMAGIGSQEKLIDELMKLKGDGVEASLDTSGDWGVIGQRANAGHPVVVSNAAHYFVIDAYDPDSGRYHVGTSVDYLRGGEPWMTAAQIEKSGKITGAIYADAPIKQEESVVQAVEAGRPTESLPAGTVALGGGKKASPLIGSGEGFTPGSARYGPEPDPAAYVDEESIIARTTQAVNDFLSGANLTGLLGAGNPFGGFTDEAAGLFGNTNLFGAGGTLGSSGPVQRAGANFLGGIFGGGGGANTAGMPDSARYGPGADPGAYQEASEDRLERQAREAWERDAPARQAQMDAAQAEIRVLQLRGDEIEQAIAFKQREMDEANTPEAKAAKAAEIAHLLAQTESIQASIRQSEAQIAQNERQIEQAEAALEQRAAEAAAQDALTRRGQDIDWRMFQGGDATARRGQDIGWQESVMQAGTQYRGQDMGAAADRLRASTDKYVQDLQTQVAQGLLTFNQAKTSLDMWFEMVQMGAYVAPDAEYSPFTGPGSVGEKAGIAPLAPVRMSLADFQRQMGMTPSPEGPTSNFNPFAGITPPDVGAYDQQIAAAGSTFDPMMGAGATMPQAAPQPAPQMAMAQPPPAMAPGQGMMPPQAGPTPQGGQGFNPFAGIGPPQGGIPPELAGVPDWLLPPHLRRGANQQMMARR